MSTRLPERWPGPGASQRNVALVDLLDEALGTGVTVSGDVLLSVADVDLVIVSLRALLSSVQGILGKGSPEDPWQSPDRPPSVDPSGGPTEPTGARRSEKGPSPAGTSWSSGEEDISRPATEQLTFQRPLSSRGLTRGGSSALFARPAAARVQPDAEHLERGLAKLVLTLVELLRELMERQALRRLEGDSLTAEQIERLGITFKRLRSAIEDLKRKLGLEGEDLNLDLGPLGRLL